MTIALIFIIAFLIMILFKEKKADKPVNELWKPDTKDIDLNGLQEFKPVDIFDVAEKIKKENKNNVSLDSNRYYDEK